MIEVMQNDLRAQFSAEELAVIERVNEPENEHETVCEICDGARYVRLAVGMNDPRFGKPWPCSCVTDFPVEERISRAGIPEGYSESMTRASWKAGRNDGAIQAVDRWDHDHNLLLFGDAGRGKTHLAVVALMDAMLAGKSGRFCYVPDLLDDIRRRYRADAQEDAQTFVDRLLAVPVLVLDDLGAERANDWVVERITAMLDRRIRTGATTIVTTNLSSAGELDEVFGQRIASRLGPLNFQWIECKGADMRHAR